MSTLLGRIDKFDRTKEEWTQYVKRMDHFFAANDITEASKKNARELAEEGPSVSASESVHRMTPPACMKDTADGNSVVVVSVVVDLDISGISVV